MYIKKTRTFYDSYGGQHAGRQWFLILVQPGEKVKSVTSDYEYYLATRDETGEYPKPRAIVRKVALEQCGHFMMGYARAFGHSIIISGAYGSDGLPKTVAQDVYDRAISLPDDLYDAWAHGGGHNSAGNEAQLMRQWAIDNFDKLAPKNAQL